MPTLANLGAAFAMSDDAQTSLLPSQGGGGIFEAKKAFDFLSVLFISYPEYGKNTVLAFLISIFGLDGELSAKEFDFMRYLARLSVCLPENRKWYQDLMHTRQTPFLTTLSFFEGVATMEKSFSAEYVHIRNRFRMPGESALALSCFQTLGLYAIAIEDDPGGKKVRALCEYITKTEQLLIDLGVGPKSADECQVANTVLNRPIPQLHLDTTEEPGRPSQQSLADMITALDRMTGLQSVKHEVMSLINLARVGQLRRQQGLSEIPITLHLVFTGNPGTGKTTVARLVASIYKELGLVSKGQLVETDRAGLVAGYVGQTALKVKAKVDEALGGILFIDEAYSLSSQSQEDFGHEAIEVLLKSMEDYRNDLVVIAAGYSEQMSGFLNANPGLKSRFGRVITFEDYSPDDLFDIFLSMSEAQSYALGEAATRAVRQSIQRTHRRRGPSFGNAREIRNLLDVIIATQSGRVASMASPSRDDLITITEADIPSM